MDFNRVYKAGTVPAAYIAQQTLIFTFFSIPKNQNYAYTKINTSTPTTQYTSMKTPHFFFSLLLFAGFFFSEAQAQTGLHGQFAFIPDMESRPLFRDQFSSRAVEDSKPYIENLAQLITPPPIDAASSQEASLMLFYNWLYGWFFVGKYIAYKSSNFTYQFPVNTPATHSKDKIKPNTKHSRVSKPKGKKQKGGKKQPVSTLPDVIPEKYQPLTSSLNTHGITYKDLSTENKPADFPSSWVWIVISWVDNALKQNQGLYDLSDRSFDSILADTDPALPAIVRGTLRAVLFVENESTGEESDGDFFSDKHVALTIGWMDYMFLQYNCPFNWRSWLTSSSKPGKPSLLNSDRESLMTFDTSNSGKREIARKLNLSEKMLNSREKPRIFRSDSLWIIIEEFYSDSLHCQDASQFSTIFPADLIFADTVSSVIFEIFSTPSALTKKELYLMEYWLDQATEHLFDQTQTYLEWRDLIKPAPNNPDYFKDHPLMLEKDTEKTTSSHPIEQPVFSTSVTHRHAFKSSAQTTRQYLFQFDDSDMNRGEDESGSDFEMTEEDD